MQKYFGSCHCGKIKFSIKTAIEELTTCDCSLCVKKNALMTKIHEDKFTLIEGQAFLKKYQWNMKIAEHYFCKECGIYTFHRKRAMPKYFGINIHCLDDFDHSNVSIRATKGDNMSVDKNTAIPTWPGPRV